MHTFHLRPLLAAIEKLKKTIVYRSFTFFPLKPIIFLLKFNHPFAICGFFLISEVKVIIYPTNGLNNSDIKNELQKPIFRATPKTKVTKRLLMPRLLPK
jgi:hypothetical protein